MRTILTMDMVGNILYGRIIIAIIWMKIQFYSIRVHVKMQLSKDLHLEYIHWMEKLLWICINFNLFGNIFHIYFQNTNNKLVCDDFFFWIFPSSFFELY